MRVSRETIASGLLVLLVNGPAGAAVTASGAAALALAALVGQQSPTLPRLDKRVLAQLFGDKFVFAFPAGKTIPVAADVISCRASNVDIALHACELAFGEAQVALDGRRAHELFVTLAEAGVKSEGSVRSQLLSLKHLACTIDPNAVKQRAGGGAQCQFDAGPP
jgi:hypothetical protein